MRLSANFTLSEFLQSQTATRHGLDMTPSRKIIDQLQLLVDTCLQPLRTHVDAVIYISSGYRPQALNTLIGGSLTSAHVHGRAVDFSVVGMAPLAVCTAAQELELPYDQIIHEFGRWTHMGISDTPRSEELTAYRDKGGVHYVFGLKSMEDVP